MTAHGVSVQRSEEYSVSQGQKSIISALHLLWLQTAACMKRPWLRWYLYPRSPGAEETFWSFTRSDVVLLKLSQITWGLSTPKRLYRCRCTSGLPWMTLTKCRSSEKEMALRDSNRWVGDGRIMRSSRDIVQKRTLFSQLNRRKKSRDGCPTTAMMSFIIRHVWGRPRSQNARTVKPIQHKTLK